MYSIAARRAGRCRSGYTFRCCRAYPRYKLQDTVLVPPDCVKLPVSEEADVLPSVAREQAAAQAIRSVAAVVSESKGLKRPRWFRPSA